MPSTIISTCQNPAATPLPKTRAKSRPAPADMSTLAAALRSAMAAVDNLSKQSTSAKDDGAMSKAMKPVDNIFAAIKAAAPTGPHELALQLSIIAEVSEWFGSSENNAMEDISSSEFRRIADNARAVLTDAACAFNPPQITVSRDATVAPDYEALNEAAAIIDCSMAPIEDEQDLLDHLLYLKDDNDIFGATCLFNAFVDMADGILAIENQPRCTGRAAEFLFAEWERQIARAYLVGDVLKDMKPGKYNIDHWSETLTRCAFMMGHGDRLSLIANMLQKASALQKALSSTGDEPIPQAV